ncbi:MAG: bifunctional phosphopantothenoylcysteine decarboxylase/phosphopantothenate--cysteine ligase CoaBC [Holophagales bacterium]|jgi:phosphopantothenoylcysteine decarboxylase/phosphopantothenate--cysteine ligase|nr:bifunctional phosphopantothenoylcysteine decarboxylase/phosphopantothenate--cysteine ligase CoaBC [Holophagales bacterium]
MKVLLGVTGGIAAYKAGDLIRMLVRAGHHVRCCLTDAGSRFITPLTLATLSGEPCFGANPEYHEWRPNPRVEHVDLARWADILAVVPATADIIGKTANGLADDLLSTLLLAAECKVLWAPAMNRAMWGHPAVQKNIAVLLGYEHHVVYPASGVLACGEEGTGKLASVEEVFEAIGALGSAPLKQFTGKRVMVTAGPTHEDLDPVRTLTNRSTGRMGIEMSRAFRDAGAAVHLILGGELPAPWGIDTIRVRSAEEMLNACLALWPDMDGVCAAAAVADQRPERFEPQKVKKQDAPETVVLLRTPDILAALSNARTHQWMLGFAAESENLVQNATEKLSKKGLNAILLNDISQGKGFGDHDNCLIPITRNGPGGALGPVPKNQLAREAVAWFANHLEINPLKD